jgi:protein SDA1
MQLLSRVIGVHKLCVLPFYSYIMKYLTYHQLRVPSILVALAQSVHDLSPPDAIIPIIKKLAHEFVHPGVGSEVITAGLNAIREVCRRQPLAMEEDLLGDLVAYRKSRDKAAMAAARGLLRLYREVNPSMLNRRERVRQLIFPRQPLEKYSQGLNKEERPCIDGIRGDSAAWEGWDIGSESPSENSGDEGWIDVGSDNGQPFDISDSEDERSLETGVGKPVEGNGATNFTSLAATKVCGILFDRRHDVLTFV